MRHWGFAPLCAACPERHAVADSFARTIGVMTQLSRSETSLPFMFSAMVAIPIVALLAAGLGEPIASDQTFFIYLIPQLCLLILASSLRPDPYFFTGTTMGMAITLFLHALWELRWRTGPNSMPFFVFLFMATPAVALGIVAANRILNHLPASRLASAFVAVGCTTPFAWLILYSAIADPRTVITWP